MDDHMAGEARAVKPWTNRCYRPFAGQVGQEMSRGGAQRRIWRGQGTSES
jgi:hypothetical protein